MNKWTESSAKFPPACQEVLVKRWKSGKSNNRELLVTEVYFISTHPKECVEEDKIVAWMRIPAYEVQS